MIEYGNYAFSAFFDNTEMNINITELNNKSRYFQVNKRYRLNILLPDNNIRGELTFAIDIRNAGQIRVIEETGENLFAVSYYYGNSKICIGTVGDLPDLEYGCENGIIKIDGLFVEKEVVFLLSYVDECNESTEISSWFAADPSLFIDEYKY